MQGICPFDYEVLIPSLDLWECTECHRLFAWNEGAEAYDLKEKPEPVIGHHVAKTMTSLGEAIAKQKQGEESLGVAPDGIATVTGRVTKVQMRTLRGGTPTEGVPLAPYVTVLCDGSYRVWGRASVTVPDGVTTEQHLLGRKIVIKGVFKRQESDFAFFNPTSMELL